MHGSALHRYAEHCISVSRFLNLCIPQEAPQWHRIQNAVLLMDQQEVGNDERRSGEDWDCDSSQYISTVMAILNSTDT